MPAVSKKQYRLMQAAAHGEATDTDIDPKEAKEYVRKTRLKGLPEQVKKPSK